MYHNDRTSANIATWPLGCLWRKLTAAGIINGTAMPKSLIRMQDHAFGADSSHSLSVTSLLQESLASQEFISLPRVSP